MRTKAIAASVIAMLATVGALRAETVTVSGDPEYVWAGAVCEGDYAEIDAIEFAEGVEWISEWAVELESVVPLVKIPKTVMEIDGGFHSGTAEFEVHPENRYFKTIGGALYKVGQDGEPVTLVQAAVNHCGAVFAIPETVKRVCADAFASCTGIKKVKIPASVAEIGDFAFAKCAIEEIELAPENGAFELHDGALYTKNGEKLVAYPQGRAGSGYAVREGTRTIGFGAFNSAKNLKKVTLPGSVGRIECSAFSWAGELAELEVQGSGALDIEDAVCDGTAIAKLDLRNRDVTVEAWAFGGTPKLKTVHFGSLAFFIDPFDGSAYEIFDGSGVTDVYCRDDSWFPKNKYNTPWFGKALTLHVPESSSLPGEFEDGGWTVKVVKDLNGTEGGGGDGGEGGDGEEEGDDEPVTVDGVTVVVSGDSTGTGTASGGGKYRAGQKATLTAKPAKGSVFAGWFDADGKPLEGSVDYRTLKFPYVVEEENVLIEALFATAAEDGDLRIEMDEESETAKDGSWEGGFRVESLTLPKISVKGLPKGLKWDAKQNKVTGKASAPGRYKVKVSASNATVKRAVAAETVLVVPNLRSGLYEELDTEGTYELTAGVGAGGVLPALGVEPGRKVTMKGLPSGMKWDARTGTIAGAPAKPGDYTVTITTKEGKESHTDTISIRVGAMAAGLAGTYNGFAGYCDNRYGPVEFTYRGTLTMKAAANGKITAKVATASGTYSFSAKNWDWANEDGEYGVEMRTRNGDVLKIAVDPGAASISGEGFGGLRGEFIAAGGAAEMAVAGDPDMLAKAGGAWRFAEAGELVRKFAGRTIGYKEGAEGGVLREWEAVEDARGAELTVKIDGSGKVSVSGKVDGVKVSGKGDVTRDLSVVVKAGRERRVVNLYFGYRWGEEWVRTEAVD